MKLQKLDSKIFQFIKNIRIAVLVLGTAILFYACENNDIDKIQTFSSPEALPTLEAINFETLYTDSGQIRYSLKTPRLLRFENEGKTYHEFPDGMEIIKYNEKQEIISTIRADYAKDDPSGELKREIIDSNLFIEFFSNAIEF